MAHPYDDRYRESHRPERGFARDDRGFFERAGEEVRSWFGHDEAERHRRMDEERARREGMTPERSWSGGERGERPDRWRNEPGYGRRPDEDRSMHGERWQPGEGPRDSSTRWHGESTWGPATWSQGDRWRRESAVYGDRSSREPGWVPWPREEGSRQGQRRPGESRGFYEDDRGTTYQFAHRPEMNYSGRGPKGYRRSDERIREEICDRLTDDWRVDATEMEVTVSNGQVTLAGSVNSREEKRKAEDLVEAIPGVQDVHNTLRISQWDDGKK
jgi:osmotically-inducible protein OsmY